MPNCHAKQIFVKVHADSEIAMRIRFSSPYGWWQHAHRWPKLDFGPNYRRCDEVLYMNHQPILACSTPAEAE
jgi:hypothetical protein